MQNHQKHTRSLGCESCIPLVENFEPLEINSTRGAYCCHQKSPNVKPIPNILNVGQCLESGGYKSVWQPSECFNNVENYTPTPTIVENYTPTPPVPTPPVPTLVSSPNSVYVRRIPENFIYQPTDYTNFMWSGSSINGAGRSCCQNGCNGCRSCGNVYDQYFTNACYLNSCQ